MSKWSEKMKHIVNKKILLLLTSFFCLIRINLVANSSFEGLKDFSIYPDSPCMDSRGYGDCNMETNGESAIAKIGRPGDVVFDVGAHTGEWSLQVITNQPLVKLYGFEPLVIMHDLYKAKLKNYCIELSPLALSNEKSTKEFTYYAKHPQLSTLHQRFDIEKAFDMAPTHITVQTERLDAFCQQRNITSIDFLKIDTEGNELNVLKGADYLLKMQAISIIQFEYGGCYLDSKSTLQEIYKYLTNYGYSIYRIIPEGLIHIKQWRPELENFAYSNYLAVKK